MSKDKVYMVLLDSPEHCDVIIEHLSIADDAYQQNPRLERMVGEIKTAAIEAKLEPVYR